MITMQNITRKTSVKAKSTKINGLILWQGESVLDGSPIVCIATLSTTNKKTGDMVQTWILRSDMKPMDASKNGLDSAICGSCIHRHYLGGACYVTVFQAPTAVYKAFKAGKYSMATNENKKQYLSGRAIRLGAYGDPSAVPFSVWANLAPLASAMTGYTHQINHKNFDPRILDFCMVSADTPNQARKAQKLGARTFRVMPSNSQIMPGELECKADSEDLTCIECKLCNGNSQIAPNIAIVVHGAKSKSYEEKFQIIGRFGG